VPAEIGQIGRRVRFEREKAGFSLSKLASLSGVSKTYLVKLENHRTNPSLQVLGQIAEGLDITVADLVGGPRFRYQANEDTVPPSLLAFAEEEGLTDAEIITLSSIRFRQGDQPSSKKRWRYIYNSLTVSRSLDSNDDEKNLD
jgi:transcriptional regulator with XRE-family HTH domain